MLSNVLKAQLITQGATGPFLCFPVADNRADVYSAIINPALASFKEKFSIALFGEKPLLIRNFNSFGFTCLFPVENVKVFTGINRSGIESFTETNFKLGLGRELGTARIGIAGNYHSISLKDYGGIRHISLEVGAMVKLTSDVITLFHVKGISLKSNDSTDRTNSLNVSGGLIYKVSEEVTLGMNWVKAQGSVGTVHMNARYFAETNLSVTLGYISNINCIYFGTTYRRTKLSISLTARYHQVFGLIPTTMIEYEQ